jgi:predicted nucleic acid-binding protein
MSRTLLDSSAILNLFRVRGKAAMPILAQSSTLSLTPYEIGNALRTEAYLRRTTTPEKAERALTDIMLLLGLTEIIHPDPREAAETLRIAGKNSLTYYDASYLHTAMKGQGLATEDSRLAEAAKREGILILTASQLSSS